MPLNTNYKNIKIGNTSETVVNNIFHDNNLNIQNFEFLEKELEIPINIANGLIQPPDNTEANNVGIARVEITKDGRFKFIDIKGRPFDIDHFYESVEKMEADLPNVDIFDWAIIQSLEGAEDEDNAKLFKVVAPNGVKQWLFMSDLSGVQGDTGATFTPVIALDGTLYWTNDKGKDNPPPTTFMKDSLENSKEALRIAEEALETVVTNVGTKVTVNGVAQSTWEANTKADVNDITVINNNLVLVNERIDNIDKPLNTIHTKIGTTHTFTLLSGSHFIANAINYTVRTILTDSVMVTDTAIITDGINSYTFNMYNASEPDKRFEFTAGTNQPQITFELNIGGSEAKGFFKSGGLPPALQALVDNGIVIDGQTINIGEFVFADGTKISNKGESSVSLEPISSFGNRVVFTVINETYGILVNGVTTSQSYISKIDISGTSPKQVGNSLNIDINGGNLSFSLINQTYGIVVGANPGSSTYGVRIAKINISGTSPVLSGTVTQINIYGDYVSFSLINQTYGIITSGNDVEGSTGSSKVAKINISGTSPALSGSILTISSYNGYAAHTLINETLIVLAGGSSATATKLTKIDISDTSLTSSGSALIVSSITSDVTLTTMNNTYCILTGSSRVAKINISGTNPALSGSVLLLSSIFNTLYTFSLINQTYGIATGYRSGATGSAVAKINISGTSPVLSGSTSIAQIGGNNYIFKQINETYGLMGLIYSNNTTQVFKIDISNDNPILRGSPLILLSYYNPMSLAKINENYFMLAYSKPNESIYLITRISVSGTSPSLDRQPNGIAIENKSSGESIQYLKGVFA